MTAAQCMEATQLMRDSLLGSNKGKWTDKFNKLVLYIHENDDNLSVLIDHELYYWAFQQHTLKSKNKLSQRG